MARVLLHPAIDEQLEGLQDDIEERIRAKLEQRGTTLITSRSRYPDRFLHSCLAPSCSGPAEPSYYTATWLWLGQTYTAGLIPFHQCMPISLRKVGARVNRSHFIEPMMTGEVKTDDRGRVTIPKELRDRFGDRYRLVALPSGIKLVPMPDDPVSELRAAASDELREASLEEIEEAARQAGHDQVDEHVR